jgi:FkbM family methyltransferase
MKRIIRKYFRKIGIEIQRFTPEKNPTFQLLKGLEKFRVDLVFDIGANIGQFARDLRYIGYKGRIISYEPLSDAYAQLSRIALKDKKWQVHKRGAVGDTNGNIIINISGNSVSSSLLPMLDAHSLADSGSVYISQETTPIQTLDDAAKEYINKASNIFIKIDTQGFEWQVLNGGQETLRHACGVQLELSLVPLYEGQKLWMEIIERLEKEGFTLWSIQNGFTDPHDGKTLQVDAIFFRCNDIINRHQ